MPGNVRRASAGQFDFFLGKRGKLLGCSGTGFSPAGKNFLDYNPYLRL
jgi:hypothetical protein